MNISDDVLETPTPQANNSLEAGTKRTARMCVSVLLDYPAEDFHEELDVITLELDNVDPAVADELEKFISWARETDLRALEAKYVETFDKKRKCSLHLSYYTTGDTRLRGGALVTFRQAFEANGWLVTGGELPDYLPAVCELSARTGDELAEHLLRVNRDGVEVLRTALESLNSPWASVVNALALTLEPLDERAKESYRKLISQGPPAEMIGIADLPFPLIGEDAHR